MAGKGNEGIETIHEKLTAIFRGVFRDPALEISETSTPQTIANWDSLAHVQLMLAVEKAFKIRFALGELQAMQNAGDLMRSIEKKTQAA